MPEISIVVPVYNAEKFLKKCLDALIGQTFTDIEIICVDDGSTDSSGNILDEYAARDPRIKAIHQENSGPCGARNKGLDVAKSPRIMFCDSDDWVEPTMCARLLSVMNAKKVDLVSCNPFMEADSRHVTAGIGDFSPIPPGKYTKLDNIFFAMSGTVWSCIFSKKLLDKYNIRFDERTLAEDYIFTRKYLLICGSFYVIKDKLYHYVLRDGSLIGQWKTATNGSIPHWIHQTGDYKYLFYFCRDKNIYKKYCNLLTFNYVLYIVYYWRLLPDNAKTEYLKEIKKAFDDLSISDWGSSKNNQLIRAIQEENYAQAKQRLKRWPYQSSKLWWIYGRLVLYRFLYQWL